jgi:Gas vesicle protein K
MRETVSQPLEPGLKPADNQPLGLSEADLNALHLDLGNLGAFPRSKDRLELDPEAAQNGLAKLVLTVVELLRQLSERQAVRRMEAGSLTDEEIERVGSALLRLEDKMKDLKEHFGLSDEDLNLDLGPLGRLL